MTLITQLDDIYILTMTNSTFKVFQNQVKLSYLKNPFRYINCKFCMSLFIDSKPTDSKLAKLFNLEEAATGPKNLGPAASTAIAQKIMYKKRIKYLLFFILFIYSF